VAARSSFDLASVAEALDALENVQGEWLPSDGQWQRLRASGAVRPEQLRAIAEAEVPNLAEIAAQPRFEAGVKGLMQLVVLVCLGQRLRWGALPELSE
jgi:hypothetical protein